MLQQTTVNTVIPYYERWTKAFPDVQSVARSNLQKILRLWQGLGYYQRAKNIHRCAKVLCDKYDGQIPKDPDLVRGLPGFGPYTTGAVLSIAFDQRVPIIDANVRRVIMRVNAVEGHADTSRDRGILDFLGKVMPRKGNNIFNQAMMELGALVCRNRTPLCLTCPVRSQCRAYEKGIQEIIPEPKKKVIRDVEAVIAVVERSKKFFIQKRASQGLWADLWEFPGGKIEKGETPAESLRREVKEELGVEVESAKPLMNVRHFYTQFRVNLHVFSCTLTDEPAIDADHRWVSRRRLTEYPMPSGSAKIVERLEAAHVEQSA